MNLLLLEQHQLVDGTEARLTDAQVRHIIQVLRAEPGAQLKVGRLNGSLGRGQLAHTDGHYHLTNLALDKPAPANLPTTLILALPRPQMIKRILQTVACMGVSRICLIQTAKVEKSYWQSPAVTDQAIHEQLMFGLEQAGATQLPTVEKYLRFRPFAEDRLPEFTPMTHKLLVHPGPFPPCPRLADNQPSLLAIGPEGGFTEQEVAYFTAAGFTPIQLGPRILKVEIAVPVTLARLYDGQTTR